jgi:hypothetical protein
MFGQQGWGGNQPVEGQTYKLLSGLGHNLALDVSGNPNDHNKLLVWEDHNGPNQKFTLKSVGNGRWGLFSLKNGHTV